MELVPLAWRVGVSEGRLVHKIANLLVVGKLMGKSTTAPDI